MMAKGDKTVKDPNRLAKAQAVKAACDDQWQRKPGSKLEVPGHRDGLKIVVSQPPEFITDKEGEIVGVDAWVQLFDDKGRELPIDPHRRIINPPTVPRAGIRIVGEDQDGNPIRELTLDPMTAFWEVVRDSIEHTPNEKGWRTRGTVTTVFGDAADGRVISSSVDYPTARAMGAGLSADTTGDFLIGFDVGATYSFRQAFLAFDTSAITDTDVVSTIVLDLWLTTDNSTSDFTVEVRAFDWGATVTTADAVAGASLGSNTLVASISTSGIGATGAYKTFTSEVAFLSITNLKTGVVRLIAHGSTQRTDTVAPGDGNDRDTTWESSDTAGTTNDPKLTITHAAALTAQPPFYSRPNRIWRIW